jgi:hypothetical protein
MARGVPGVSGAGVATEVGAARGIKSPNAWQPDKRQIENIKYQMSNDNLTLEVL